jgi:nucleotide-binding universal stress UspA family protein
MADTVLLCADGSALSTAALLAGVGLVGPGADYLLVTVVEPVDPMLATGSGFAGGTMTPDELGELEVTRRQQAAAMLAEVAADLGMPDVATRALVGHPGPAVVRLAEELGARGIVLGSRGRGGLKRALLGSVSDHVVRNAPCPVVVTGPADEPDGA